MSSNLNRPVRVLVVGLGIIGKRLADAIAHQDGMAIAGVVVRGNNRNGRSRLRLDVPLFTSAPTGVVASSGTLEDALEACDIVLDCTTEGVGSSNSYLYRRTGIRYILQGGEPSDSVELGAYSTLCNFDATSRSSSARVVSCNTTAQARVLAALSQLGPILNAEFTIVKRGADPARQARHELNALHPTLGTVTHHVDDLRMLFPGVKFWARAIRTPTTLMHLNVARVELVALDSRSSVFDVMSSSDRLLLVDGASTGLTSTAQLIELARDLKRARADLPEVIVWRDAIDVDGPVVRFPFAVHMESVVLPETLDCVRGLTGLSENAEEAMAATDAGLKAYYGPALRSALPALSADSSS